MHYVTGTKIIRQKKPTVFDIADYPTKKSSAVFDIPQLTKHIPCPIYAAIGLANKRKPAKQRNQLFLTSLNKTLTKHILNTILSEQADTIVPDLWSTDAL